MTLICPSAIRRILKGRNSDVKLHWSEAAVISIAKVASEKAKDWIVQVIKNAEEVHGKRNELRSVQGLASKTRVTEDIVSEAISSMSKGEGVEVGKDEKTT